MTWLEFIASLIGSLAWPLVIIAALVVFRKPIEQQIRTIRRVQWGDKAVDFDLRLDQVEQQAAETLPEAGAVLQLPSSGRDAASAQVNTERFESALEVAPRLAIVDSWLPLESELQRLALQQGYDSRARSTTFVLRRLQLDGLLAKDIVKLLDDLRTLRNHAVHRTEEGEISPEDARRYRQLAELAIARLREIS